MNLATLWHWYGDTASTLLSYWSPPEQGVLTLLVYLFALAWPLLLAGLLLALSLQVSERRAARVQAQRAAITRRLRALSLD